MMPFLARQRPLAQPSHESYQTFSQSLHNSLPQDYTFLQQRFGQRTVNDALFYDTHKSWASVEKSLSASENYALQGSITGHIISTLPPPSPYFLSIEIEQKYSKASAYVELYGENNQTGYVRFIREGSVLELDEEYRQNLPPFIALTTNFNTPFHVPVMSYLSQIAIRRLIHNPTEITHFKINRIQNRPMLAHVDWMLRSKKTNTVEEAIAHTQWHNRISAMMDMAGFSPHTNPRIIYKGSQEWHTNHPEAELADWDDIIEIEVRNHLENTVPEYALVSDDNEADWRSLAYNALEQYKAHLSAPQRADLEQSLDKIINDHYALEARYNITEKDAMHTEFDIEYDVRQPYIPTDQLYPFPAFAADL